MSPTPALTERELQVLAAVIEEYVATAEPAGSQTLAKRYGLGVSSATIRSTMSELEVKGYLFHPHTSAGRIPTDRAYRVYIDELMRQRKVGDEVREQVDSDLDSAGGDVSRLFSAASRLLSQLSGEVGFVVAPDALHTVVKSLRFLAVAAGKILCVQVNEPDVVISRVLETGTTYSPAELEELVRRAQLRVVHTYGEWMVPGFFYRSLRYALMRSRIAKLPKYPPEIWPFGPLGRSLRARFKQRRVGLYTCAMIGTLGRKES